MSHLITPFHELDEKDIVSYRNSKFDANKMECRKK